MYSDERRIAALLRDLIQQSGTPLDTLDLRLGWEPGRLEKLLAQGVSFDVLLDVLPFLDATPGDFFARLYAYNPLAAEHEPLRSSGNGGGNGNGNGHGNGGRGPKAPDRRFEESRRVVKAAIARRGVWKEERCELTAR
jgi:hypothetical protein